MAPRLTQALTVADVRALGGYEVIYLDPAWHYRNHASNGAAVDQYNTVVREELARLPIGDLAAKHCALFCWATYPLLPDFLATLARWGFKYSTIAFQWVKYYGRTLKPAELRAAARELEAIADAIERGLITGKEIGLKTSPCLGLGNWTRANTEPCFIATRGRPKRLDKGISQLVEEVFENYDEEVVRAPRNRHSAKPLQVRQRIVQLMGASTRRLEMFARNRGDGFDAWGDDPALGGPDILITDRDLAVAHYVDGGMTMTQARRHWIMYCILNKRGDHGANDQELAAVRAELAEVLR